MKHWTGISEFVAVAELQSFTKAAKQLGISVAQVSRNIAELEASLAIKLLYRSTRSVSLTEEGLLYLQHCKHLVASLDEANRTLANLKATPRGQIKLTWQHHPRCQLTRDNPRHHRVIHLLIQRPCRTRKIIHHICLFYQS